MKTLIPLTTNALLIEKIDAPSSFFNKLEEDFNQCEFRKNSNNYISEDINILNNHSFLEKKFSELTFEFVTKLLKVPCDDMKITNSWFNKTEKDQFHHWHKHYFSIVSGVFFLDDNPENLNLTFEIRNQLNLIDFMFSTVSLKEMGAPSNLKHHLLLFPSIIKHSVSPNQSEQPRKSLSFDTWFKGNVGVDRLMNANFS